MSILAKQIYCWILTILDILGGIFALVGVLEEPSEAPLLFVLLLWFGSAVFFHMDYLKLLHYQKEALTHQEVEEQVAQIHADADDALSEKADQIDDVLAEDIRKTPEEDPTPDPDELKEMLAKDHLEQTDDTEQESKSAVK